MMCRNNLKNRISKYTKLELKYFYDAYQKSFYILAVIEQAFQLLIILKYIQ